MKRYSKQRILTFILALTMIFTAIPMNNMVANATENVNYSTSIGAVAKFMDSSLVLNNGPKELDGRTVYTEELPAEVVICNYCFDDMIGKYFYEIDAAPGYEWSETYADYHWVYADEIQITDQNGMTGVFDANGNEVTELELPLYDKVALTAESSLQGAVQYQWQICYDAENDLWVDIYGENSAELTVTYGIMATLLDDNNSAKVRCQSVSGTKTNTSAEIVVTVVEEDNGVGDAGDNEGDDTGDTTEAALEVQMDGVAVSVIKVAYGDSDFTAPLTAVVSGLNGEVTYFWKLIKVDGTEVVLDETSASITLDYWTINNNAQKFDDTKFLVTLSVTATNGTDFVTENVELHSLSNSASGYITTEDGQEIDVIVAGDLPDGTTLDLTKTESSVTLPEGEEILVALDITLRDSQGNEWQPESGETVTVTLDADRLGLNDGDYFAVYHVHEGETQKLGPYMVQDGSVTFEVVGFSEFIFVEAEVEGNIGKTAKIVTSNLMISTDPEDFLGTISLSADLFPEVVEIIGYYYDEVNSRLWYRITAPTWPEEYAAYSYVYDYAIEIGDYELVGGTGGETDDGTEEDDTTEEKTPVCTVTVDGEEVTEITVSLFNKVTLSAESTLPSADISYQWQVYLGDMQEDVSGSDADMLEDVSDGNADLWVDIFGANSNTFRINYGVLSGVMDENGVSYFRCITSAGTQTAISKPIKVSLAERISIIKKFAPSYGVERNLAYAVMPLAERNTGVAESIDITIRFVNGPTGETVADDKTYNIQAGTTLSETFTLPEIEGYSAYLGDDTTTIYTSYTFNDVFTEDTTITFKYWPAKVNYTVIYYWQNTEDDDYTEHERYTTEGFTGSYTTVEDKQYEGFYQLLYETVPIASDGSTVIEVYYDRLYYKMTFDLDGGYGVQPVYARYGTPITVSNPTKAGYAFVGWDDITTGTGNGIADSLPTIIPAQHSAYKAIWKANDSAKVTIVYWGENADDEGYSYEKSQEVFVAPGTEITFGSNQLICTLSEHIHGDGNCSYKCNLEVHTHSESCYQLTCTQEIHIHDDRCYDCGQESHIHDINCYPNVGNNFIVSTSETYVKGTESNGTIGESYLWYLFGESATGNKYIYIDGTWYRYSGNANVGSTVSTTCGKTESTHTHADTCLSCDKQVHTHTNYTGSCYTLSCGKLAHSHVADCYSCVQHTHTDDCYLKISNMDSDLWTYVESDTVTVAADGSTVMNVYYDRITFTITFHYNRNNSGNYQSTSSITDKWGADIANRFLNVNTTAKGNLWSESSSGNSPWTSYLQIMPQRNVDYYCKHTSTNAQSAEYYIQELDGTYSLEYTVNAYYSDGTLTISKEDFYDMVGFTYSHGTDGDNDDMPSPGSYGDFDGAKFYYKRNSYILDFNNGEETVKSESVLYEAALGTYDFTPEVPSFYEPGSVEFAGWYLNPECTGEQYILSEHTMPASNLILYAKWIPVKHTVRFFLDETLEFADENVYTATVEGKKITYKYDVPHGSTVQNPYTPPNDPTKGQYIFVGWFYIDANGDEQMWDFENTTVTRDTDIYAKWSSNTLVEYTVKFVYKDKDGSETEIADPITGSALGGNSKTFDAKGNDQLYTGYQEGYFPTTQSHTIVMDLDHPENNTYTFYYTYREAVPYTVYYVTDTQNDEGTLKSVTLNEKTYYILAPTKVVSDNKKAIVTETYEKVNGYLPDSYQQTLIIDPNGTNEIIFLYTKDDKNGMYVVHYWTENLDGTYSEHSVFEGRGEKESSVSAAIKDMENFTHDPNVTGTLLSGKISIDTVLELHVYYKRNTYPYKVQYLEQGSGRVLAEEKLVTGKQWEEIVTENAIEIPNYTIASSEEVTIQIRKDTENPTVNIITFYYTENKVTINYEVVGPDGCGTVSPESESVKISAGIAGGSEATASSNVYKFVGWYDNASCTGTPISTDSKYVPQKNEEEHWIDDTTYYAKFEYNLTSLTITKAGYNAYKIIDPNQTFLFRVTGSGVDLTVTVHGDSSITVTGLTVGETYTITELSDWSWRYELASWKFKTNGKSDVIGEANGAQITLGAIENVIEFTNERKNIYWLDGDSYEVNIFDKAVNASAEEKE